MTGLTDWLMQGSMVLLALSLVMTLTRLVRGPSLPDRVLALDLMATITVALVAVYAMIHDQPMLLDVAVVLALVAFLGTIGFSMYMERRLRR